MDVKTLCLGVLTERPMSGYEIKKRFEEAFQHFFVAGYGSIYPALAELHESGLVTVYNVEQAKRPDKKIYHITEAGMIALTKDLLATQPRHKVRSEFLALMYFAHLMPADKARESIDLMVGHWEKLLNKDLEIFDQDSDGQCMEPGMEFVLGFGRTVLSAAIAYVRSQEPELIAKLKQEHGADAVSQAPARQEPPRAAAIGAVAGE